MPSPPIHANQAAPALVATLARDTLLLADLGDFGCRWFDTLTGRGLWWAARLQARTSYTVAHMSYQRRDVFDELVWLGVHYASQACHPMRLVSFPVSDQVYRCVTNVHDPTRLPPREVAGRYQRR